MSDIFSKFMLGNSFQEDGPVPGQQQQAQANPNDPANMVAPPPPPPDNTGAPDPNQAPPPGPDMGGQPPASMPAGPPEGAPLDPSMGAGDPSQQQPPPDGGGDPNAMQQDPNAAGDPNAQGDPNTMQQDPNQVPPDDAGGGDPGMQGPTDINADIENAEKEVFSDLKPEQQIIMKTELKERYQELHKALIESLAKINKVSRTSYDDVMIDFIIKKMVNLKTMVSDSLVNAFNTRSYFENKKELQRFIRAFNFTSSLLDKIYESRINRQRAAAKDRESRSYTKPGLLPIFNRGYDVQ